MESSAQAPASRKAVMTVRLACRIEIGPSVAVGATLRTGAPFTHRRWAHGGPRLDGDEPDAVDFLLRQIAANAQAISTSSVFLFKPEEAIRARINSNWDQPFSIEVPHAPNVPYGAIVDYYLSHEPSGPIQLQVFDSKGSLVRTMASTPPPPIEGAAYPHYWLAAPETRMLSTHVGLNRVNWNLLYDDPPALRHDLENQMNMVEGSTTPGPHGPQVIPGVYTLKLTVDGKVYTSEVTVMNDPRVGQSPALMARPTHPSKQTRTLKAIYRCLCLARELDQIQFLLGHVSVQTTEKYPGCKQRLRNAVNGRIGRADPSPISLKTLAGYFAVHVEMHRWRPGCIVDELDKGESGPFPGAV